jgi:hypothetical protein
VLYADKTPDLQIVEKIPDDDKFSECAVRFQFSHPGSAPMLIVNIPENLSDKIKEFAKHACQTPEEYVVEMIEKIIARKSADDEAAYLSTSGKKPPAVG